MKQQRERVIILGGGMAGLSAAWALTSAPDWQERYEVTVYQEGWLLGGKGASVRNRGLHDRIEEHGLHIWMGFYDNAFRVMREVYAELGRPDDAPLATIDRAFHKQGFLTLTEEVDGAWRPWHFDGLTDAQEPGEALPLTASDYARRGVEMVTTLLGQWIREGSVGSARRTAALAALPRLSGLFEVVARTATAGAFDGLARALRDAAGAVRSLLAPLIDDDTARRLWVCLDLAATCLSGAIRDGLTAPDADFACIDDEEFRAWLRRHGASGEAIDSALVRGFYNLAFSHHDGAGAGTALLGIARMCLGWRGAIYYEMEAGMGETIFAPLYLALRGRGVRFEFFHRVKHLGVSRDGHRIDRVVVGQQATVRDGELYDPLIDVKGLPCWPESPLYEQLVEGDALRAHGHRFSSLHEAWPDVAERSLVEGRDFDRVVLAISHGALRPLCTELAAHSDRWRTMLDGVRTTGTIALQLWMRRDLRGFGWRRAAPVLGSYAGPFDTWADLSHLLPRERWSPSDGVGHVAYLCGAFGPEADTHVDHAEAQRRVWTMGVDWINAHATGLFPACKTADGGFDWNVLHDPANGVGEERLRAQYVRANTEGSERYVLFVAGSTKHRIPADDTGFDNLSIAGDWTRTGLDAGCIEAAAMSGLQAARGISGEALAIPGEAPLFRARRPRPRRGDSALPRYIDRPDEMAVRAPYGMRGVTLHAWPVRADGAAAQRLVDRYLNAPSDDALKVRVAAPWVFVAAAFLDEVGSIDTVHQHRGVMSEVDVGVWVPVTWQREGKTQRGWYLPWIFVDSGPATVSGREIFGFPKNVATMTVERDARGLAALDLRCPVMPRRGVGAVGRVDSVLRATRIDGRSGLRAVSSWRPPWTPGSVPMIFLKQFRDLASTDRACYQAVVEADARPTAIRSWGADTSDWRLDWSDAASHPIAAELGFAQSCEVGGAMVASFDFEMNAGTILYERGATGRGVTTRERERDNVIALPRGMGVSL